MIPRLRENLGGGKGVVSRTEIGLLREVCICLCVRASDGD